MGPVCDHVDRNSLGKIEEATMASNKSQYELVPVDENRDFKDKIDQISNDHIRTKVS